MAKSVYMSRSLDWVTTGLDDGLDKSRKNGGYRLHERSSLPVVNALGVTHLHRPAAT